MKTIKSGTLLYIALFLIAGIGCKQDGINKPNVINKNAPGVVSGITVTNLNGKATLTYTLPNNNDVLYVKAVYQTSAGHIEQVVKASNYTNTLTVVGFGDTLAHTVQLYAVNSSEIASAPVNVTVHPLTPAINLARRSLKVTATFGGFNVTCNNPTQENLAIIPLVDTTGKGKWAQTIGMENIYSNSVIIASTVRGQPSITRKYAFVVRDRWLNYSDTLFATLKPIFEQQLPKSDWNNYVLPGDAIAIIPGPDGSDVNRIYDGDFNHDWPSILYTDLNATTPQMITLDLGKAHLFSRMQITPATVESGNYYWRGNLRIFEIWGSNQPNISGALDASWTKLVTCTVIKPSGSPYGIETGADQAAAQAGWQFDFPIQATSYRYVRIRNLQNWEGDYSMAMAQFTLWGQ